MNFFEGIGWFSATSAAIFAPFAIVEKFSSNSDLENYYLLITVKRPIFSGQWYLLLIRFVDLFFGFHTVLGKLMVPSTLRVMIYTTCINGIFLSFVFFMIYNSTTPIEIDYHFVSPFFILLIFCSTTLISLRHGQFLTLLRNAEILFLLYSGCSWKWVYCYF
jgi:hypothetical protein